MPVLSNCNSKKIMAQVMIPKKNLIAILSSWKAKVLNLALTLKKIKSMPKFRQS